MVWASLRESWLVLAGLGESWLVLGQSELVWGEEETHVCVSRSNEQTKAQVDQSPLLTLRLQAEQ